MALLMIVMGVGCFLLFAARLSPGGNPLALGCLGVLGVFLVLAGFLALLV